MVEFEVRVSQIVTTTCLATYAAKSSCKLRASGVDGNRMSGRPYGRAEARRQIIRIVGCGRLRAKSSPTE
jgi:hypothetical protein